MKLWPRKRSPRRPVDAPVSPHEPRPNLMPAGALRSLYNALTVNSVPESLEPRGDAEVYEDEIDPAERDPATAEETGGPES
jgi:hypothetical protein